MKFFTKKNIILSVFVVVSFILSVSTMIPGVNDSGDDLLEVVETKKLTNTTIVNKDYISNMKTQINAEAMDCTNEIIGQHCFTEITALLESSDTVNKLSGLNLLWRFVSEYYENKELEEKLVTLNNDSDFRVLDLSKFISHKMSKLRNPESETLVKDDSNDFTDPEIESQEMSESSTEANLIERINEDNPNNIGITLSEDDDVNVRMTSIENIIIARNDDAVELLSIALDDTDSSIRISAVDGLGQFLDEGFGDSEQIVSFLQRGLEDQDTNIVELSQEFINRYYSVKAEQLVDFE